MPCVPSLVRSLHYFVHDPTTPYPEMNSSHAHRPSRASFFKKWTSLSLFALGASLAMTPVTASAQSLPTHVLLGYWQNWSGGGIKLSSVPATYDIIAVAFAVQSGSNGAVTFALDPGLSSQLGGYTQSQFIADIAAAKARGQHVIISVGGAGTSIPVNSSSSATNFANSINSLMSQFGFDGVDIDFENGINVTYLTQALQQVKSGSIITLAPQTVDVENTSSPYFALALNIKSILTMCNTQYYNSGSMFGYDGKIYSEGGVDFITAQATILLQNGLRPDQVGLGLPASSSAAGSGYVSPSIVDQAFDILATGAAGGTFRPPQTYPTLRGIMTWSINWDAANGYNFANTVSPHIHSVGGGSEGPFGGTAAAIPGTVQAENYDTGGQGVAYNVTSINGTDNGYRSDGVDLEVTSDTGGGVDLGWTTGGQWFKYTVKVATAGTYTVSFRVAGPNAVTDAFHLSNSSGTNLSGNVNIPATGGWQTWATVTANVTLPAGQQTLTLNQDNGGWNINYASFASSAVTVATPVFSPGGGSYSSAQNVSISDSTGGASIRYTLDGSTPTSTAGTLYSGAVNISSTTTLKAVGYESGDTTSAVASATYTITAPAEGPFGGTAAAIPGTVQAENYDTGGQGVAYNVSSINGTDNGYRSDGVDLEACSDTGGGVDLGWESPGQWFRYTVNVATAGTYTVSFRVAAPNAVTDAFHLSNSSGTNLSGNVNVPATGGYQTWTTVTASVTLPAGQQVLTLNQDTGGGVWNINYMGFATSGGGTTFTITASAGSGGSISPSGGVVVNQGANQSFTIAANSGFTISSVTVDGANQGAISSYTFSNVQANHTISATFASSGGGRTLTGSSGNGWHALAISPAATGTFTATYDATPSVSPENAVVGLSNGAATAFGNLGCIARFNPSGDIDAYNGTAYAAAATIPYSANVSYHFEMDVNLSAHTYTVYVTPAGGAKTLVGSNYAFRSSANTMTSLNDWNLDVDPSIGGASLTANNLTP
jgi:chitinase